jgi:hypothetical protein
MAKHTKKPPIEMQAEKLAQLQGQLLQLKAECISIKAQVESKPLPKLSFAEIATNAVLAHDGMDAHFAEYLKHYFSSLYSQNQETGHLTWLITISKSYIDGDQIFAEKLLRLYLAKFGRQDLVLFESVCCLAADIGMNDIETDKVIEIYDEVRKIRAEQRFERLLKSAKNIAIVGRSPILLNKNLGAEIDAHDVVIRFNNGDSGDWASGKYEADYGNKIDVSLVNRFVRNTNGKDVLCIYKDFRTYWAYPDVMENIAYDITNNIDVLDFGMKEQICAETSIEDPTSGAIMIVWVKKILGSLRNVSIYAFAFQDPDMNLQHFDADHKVNHNMDIETAMLRRVIGDYKNKGDWS